MKKLKLDENWKTLLSNIYYTYPVHVSIVQRGKIIPINSSMKSNRRNNCQERFS